MLDLTSMNSTASKYESSMDLVNDRINLMAATTLLGFSYGITFTLYCITLYTLLRKLLRPGVRVGSHPRALLRPRVEWRKTTFYIVYTSVLFILATFYTAGNSQNAIIAYVDNRLYPGGPYQYFITDMASQSVMVMTDVTSTIILWMTDALILSRFIMFYYHVPYARWIIPLPCAMYVGVIVLSALVLQGEAGLGKIFYLSENMVLAYYALSFTLNVFSTILIAARLYWHKIQLERVFGPRIDTPYMSIATMLIESAALYGAWSLVFLVLCVLGNPGQTILLATMNQIQVIAPLLIILWMARGNAWNPVQNRPSEGEHGDEDVDFEAALPPSHLLTARRSGGSGRVSFGSRPTRMVVGKLSIEDDVHSTIGIGIDRNASCSTVMGGVGVDARDDDASMIELGLYGSKQTCVTVESESDVKA